VEKKANRRKVVVEENKMESWLCYFEKMNEFGVTHSGNWSEGLRVC
jgi:hypothetical protein